MNFNHFTAHFFRLRCSLTVIPQFCCTIYHFAIALFYNYFYFYQIKSLFLMLIRSNRAIIEEQTHGKQLIRTTKPSAIIQPSLIRRPNFQTSSLGQGLPSTSPSLSNTHIYHERESTYFISKRFIVRFRSHSLTSLAFPKNHTPTLTFYLVVF